MKRKLSMAIDAYISRVDACPCGETNIYLYRGAKYNTSQDMRKNCLKEQRRQKKC